MRNKDKNRCRYNKKNKDMNTQNNTAECAVKTRRDASLLLIAAALFLTVAGVRAQQTVDILNSTIVQESSYYYDGTEHIPQSSDIRILIGGSRFGTGNYTIQLLDDQDNIHRTDNLLIQITANPDFIFNVVGQIFGDYKDNSGNYREDDAPFPMSISPRVLRYDNSYWKAYDKIYDGTTAAHVTYSPPNDDPDGGNLALGGILAKDSPYLKVDTVLAHYTDNDKNCLDEVQRAITIDEVRLGFTELANTILTSQEREQLRAQYSVQHTTTIDTSPFHYPGDCGSNGNYFSSGPPLQARILKKPLTVTGWNISDKIYDGTTTSPTVAVLGMAGIIISPLTNTLEDVRPGAVTGSLSTANAGSAILEITGLALEGPDKDNYSVDANHTTNIEIQKRKLTGTWRVYDKPWDGNDTAYVWFDLSPNNIIVGREQVAFSAVGLFNNSAIGDNKPVTVIAADMTLQGLPAATANYEFPDPPIGLTAAIKCLDNSLSGGTYNWYYYTGSAQSWTAPASGYYFFEAWGARGGGDNAANGGYSGGWHWVGAGQTIYVYAGQRGKAQGEGTAWNGGGASGAAGTGNQGGGGGTDFRLASPGTINGISNSDSRFLVAGGSGGRQSSFGIASSGGGWFGGNGNGYGGTQTTGYSAGNGESGGGYDIMGAGGGWWGGGAVSTATDVTTGSGSGYIGGVADGVTTNGVNAFDGYARISQLFEARKNVGSYIYDGTPVTPQKEDITITFFNNRILPADQYEIVAVSYNNNVNAGILTASFRIRLTAACEGFCDLSKEYTVNFTIEQREIIPVINIDKTYDGSRAAYPSVTFNNIITTDVADVILNINHISYNDKQAGPDKLATIAWNTQQNTSYDKTPVFAGSLTDLIGTKRDNYKLNTGTAHPANPTGNIAKRQLTADFTAEKPYDGNNIAYITYANLNIAGEDVVRLNVTGTYNDASVGTNKSVTATASLNTDPVMFGGSNITQADFNNNYLLPNLSGLEGNIRPFNLCTDVRPHTVFPYTGNQQTFEAQAGYEYRFEVWGAHGGNNMWGRGTNTIGNNYNGTTFNDYYTGGQPGKGGYSKGNFFAPEAKTLYVYVGGTTTTTAGGFNGGARTFFGDGRGGGGASDISLATHASNDTIKGDDPRIIVAGGAGGSDYYYSYKSGGAGGGTEGGPGAKGGPGNHGSLSFPSGGRQDRGGIGAIGGAAAGNGDKGIGGFGQSCGGGGGGGGWWGGGGGACVNSVTVSGAGGSGYAGNLNGLKYGVTTGGASFPLTGVSQNDIAIHAERHGYARIGLLPTVHMKGASGNDTVFYYKKDEKIPHHIVVTIGPDTLKAGTDYELVEYRKNINASDSAECIIKGLGNYDGCEKWTFYYTINPLLIKCVLTPEVITDPCSPLPESDEPCEDCKPNKIYDSTDSANVHAVIMNETDIPEDERNEMELNNISVDAYFTDGRNAGANKEIKIRSITIPGAMGGNYALDMTDPATLTFTGSICRRPLQYRFTGQDKIYDHADSAQVTVAPTDTIKGPNTGFVPGDDLRINKWWAHFVQADGITSAWEVNYPGATAPAVKIRVDSVTLTGTDAGNYYLDTLNCSVTGGAILPLCLSGKTVEIEIQDEEILNTIDTVDFPYTGDVQTFIAPVTGFYKLEAWGAAGGGNTSIYGRGGYVSGKTILEAGDVLYIHVGQAGAVGNTTVRYNGGGPAGNTGGYAGGGATDFRTASGAWNANLTSRLLVAGGGGGSDDGPSDTNDGKPGAAGGLTGYTGSNGGNGGSQTAAGAGGNAAGGGGTGGTGGTGASDGGGGGGGYYGGAGGNNNGGGGGGSSYITTTTPTKFISPLMIDGRGFVWDLNQANYSNGSVTTNREGVTEPDGTKSTYGHTGNGYARISYAGVLVDSIYTYTADNQETSPEDIKIHTYADPNGLVEDQDYILVNDGYADNFHVGKAAITIEGKGNYNCSLQIFAFAIGPYPLVADPQVYCREYNDTDTVHITAKYNLPADAPQAIVEDVNSEKAGNIRFTARFTDGKNVGANKSITVDAVAFTAAEHSANYTIDEASLEKVRKQTATVYPRLLKGDWVAIDKMYDSRDTAYVSIRIDDNNLIDTDTVTVGFVAHYRGNADDINADDMNEKKIVIDSLLFSGPDAANYTWREIAVNDSLNGCCPVNWPEHTENNPSGMPTTLEAFINPFCVNKPWINWKDKLLSLPGFVDIDHFDFTAKQEMQEFIVPYSGYYRLEAWGAQGGRYATNKGGMGAYTAGVVYLTKDETIYVYVGLSNTAAAQNMHPYWNGGGGTHIASNTSYDYGGGATDFRIVAGPNASTWNDAKSLKSRIMVAAGGGGKGSNTNAVNLSAAGGLYNFTAYPSGQTYAAATAGAPGFGQGAQGISGASYTGAGGGWWGGTARVTNEGASGGTSYISGHLGCVAITDAVYSTNAAMNAPTTDSNLQFKGTMAEAATDITRSYSPTGKIFIETMMIDGEGRQWTTTRGSTVVGIPTPAGASETGHAGDGYARITRLVFPAGKIGINLHIDSLAVKSDGGVNNNVIDNAEKRGVVNFYCTNTVQTFTAPAAGHYQMEVWGAQGGANGNLDTQGEGGYSKGTKFLNKGDMLYVYVGQAGGAATTSTSSGWIDGGWNGGGKAHDYAGGGATDIREIQGPVANVWDDPASLNSRIIVAGGGGGAQKWNQGGTKAGGDGDGGGTNGGESGERYTAASSFTRAQGGSQTAGGAGAVGDTNGGGVAGTFGTGGASNDQWGGGGGGGWYGGGGGGYANNRVSGGGGGSGYISSELTDAVTIAGSETFLSPAGVPETGHTGNGHARITCINAYELVFRGKAYEPADFTHMTVNHITNLGDTLPLVSATDQISLSCLDSRNASDTALLRVTGLDGSNYSCVLNYPFTILQRQIKGDNGQWKALDRVYDATDSVHVVFTPVLDLSDDPDDDPEGCVYGIETQTVKDTVGYKIHYTYVDPADFDDNLTITTWGHFDHLDRTSEYVSLVYPYRAKDVLQPTKRLSEEFPHLYPDENIRYRKLVYAKVLLSGPDSANYLPPTPPRCDWDSVQANPSFYTDTLKAMLDFIYLEGTWHAANKYYDGTNLVEFGYYPDMDRAIPGDEVRYTLTVSYFKSKHVGFNEVLLSGTAQGFGKDALNYKGFSSLRDSTNDYRLPSFRATIYPRPLFHHPKDTLTATGRWTAYNKLYDALDTCRITYAIDSAVWVKKGDPYRFVIGYDNLTMKEMVIEGVIETDDDVRVEIRDGKFHTDGNTFPNRGKDAGKNKNVMLTDQFDVIDPDTGGTITKLQPGALSKFYTEMHYTDMSGSDSTVVVCDSVRMRIPYRPLSTDSLTIVLIGSDAHNYTFFDYKYDFESKYDTTAIGTIMETIYTTVKDSTLIIPETLKADIDAWQLSGEWYAPDKIYDGSTKVKGGYLTVNDTMRFTPTGEAPWSDAGNPVPAPLAGDAVYIAGPESSGDWEAHFARRDVQRNPVNYDRIDSMQVFIDPVRYSGPDAGNYLLPGPDTVFAKIHPLQLVGEYKADDREYDRTDTVHVELVDPTNIVIPEHESVKDTVHVRFWAHFENLPLDGTKRMKEPGKWYPIIDSVKISGADAYNYEPPLYIFDDLINAGIDTVRAKITRAILTGNWTAKDRAYETGQTYAEVVFIPTNRKPNSDIEVTVTGAKFSDQWTAKAKQVMVDMSDVGFSGDDAPFYDVDYTIPSNFSATIYPNTFDTEGSWNDYSHWRGYNSNTEQNQGQSQTNMLPPDSTHIHIRAHIEMNMNVPHRDSITVYDVKFTVNTGQTLTAKMFTLKGEATFINNGNIDGIDTARVVRTLKAGRNWYVSSPMDNMVPQRADSALLLNAGGLPVAGKGRVEWYSDTDYHWYPFHESGGTPTVGFEDPTSYGYALRNGMGYTAYSGTEDIVTGFKGKLNDNSMKSPDLMRTEGRIKSGYNLVGNPFPSHWKWTNTAYGTAGILPTIWYRTLTETNGYRFWTYNAALNVSIPGDLGYSLAWVPPMQAFWIRLPKGVGNKPGDYRHITFDKLNRAHGDPDHSGVSVLLKSASTGSGEPAAGERALLRIEIMDDRGLSDETVICADAGALSGYDDYDSDKMFNDSGGEIYTFPLADDATGNAEENAPLVINGLPQIQAGDTVAMGFTTDAAGSFTLRTKEVTGMGDRLSVDLYDRFTGDAVKDFELGIEYEFDCKDAVHHVSTPAAGTRFLLVFRDRLSEPSVQEISAIRIWSDRQNRLHVWNAAGKDLLLFNVQGSLVMRRRMASDRETAETALVPGIYIARAGDRAEKIIIR